MARWDEAFGNKEASNQGQMLLDGIRASEMYEESKRWIAEHPTEWRYMLYSAAIQYRSKGHWHIKKAIEDTRFEHECSIKNALSPYFARWIVAYQPELAGSGKLHLSMADGFDYEVGHG